MEDIDLIGQIIGEEDVSVLFKEQTTNREVWLKREKIAIVEHIEGVIVCLPKWLAKRKGLPLESTYLNNWRISTDGII